jgi:hypothetical protein
MSGVYPQEENQLKDFEEQIKTSKSPTQRLSKPPKRTTIPDANQPPRKMSFGKRAKLESQNEKIESIF